MPTAATTRSTGLGIVSSSLLGQRAGCAYSHLDHVERLLNIYIKRADD